LICPERRIESLLSTSSGPDGNGHPALLFLSTINMSPIRLAVHTMATRFELLLLGEDEVHLRAAGEEAIREIQLAERRFSYYDPSSELSRINRRAAIEETPVSASMGRILDICFRVHARSEGAFDPSVAPLLRAWGLRNRNDVGRTPSTEELLALLGDVGLHHAEFDRSNRTIKFHRPGMRLDLGGIVIGWVLDECRIMLQDYDIEHALMHAGTSTAVAMGKDPSGNPWRVGLMDPFEPSDSPSWFTHVDLTDQALSVSGVQGKSFIDDGTLHGHVIHPKTGMSVQGERIAACCHASAAAADAWSTALLADPDRPINSDGSRATFLKTDGKWSVSAGSWTGFGSTSVAASHTS